ncbi:hypothetical protein AB5I41_21210 [Sphingomonas sp. MMS24-JH45]
MIAPAVKASGKLVKAALDLDRAMVFACYAPSDRDAATIAVELARDSGVRLSAGAAQRIVRAAEGDRAVMAREVEKLALYLDAASERPVDADEAAVAAIGADLNEGEVGAIVEAVVAGDRRQVVEVLRRLSGPDASPIPVLRAGAAPAPAGRPSRTGGRGGGGGAGRRSRARLLEGKGRDGRGLASLDRGGAGAVARAGGRGATGRDRGWPRRRRLGGAVARPAGRYRARSARR